MEIRSQLAHVWRSEASLHVWRSEAILRMRGGQKPAFRSQYTPSTIGSQRLSLDQQAWQQAPLPTAPSSWFLFIFHCYLQHTFAKRQAQRSGMTVLALQSTPCSLGHRPPALHHPPSSLSTLPSHPPVLSLMSRIL